jgi:cellulose synthase/poly-beta-1,6-N-acetylglucosamine synthase-like glycosyltransferase
MLWRYICRDYNGGNNIYNVHGNASALRREFAASVIYPKNITADQDYLYLSMVAQQKKYKFAPDAVVLFQTPDTIRDFMFQTNRFLNEKASVIPMFGDWVTGEYQIPLMYKLEKILQYFIENPILFPFSLIIYGYTVFFYHYRDPLNKRGLWHPILSTKRPYK